MQSAWRESDITDSLLLDPSLRLAIFSETILRLKDFQHERFKYTTQRRAKRKEVESYRTGAKGKHLAILFEHVAFQKDKRHVANHIFFYRVAGMLVEELPLSDDQRLRVGSHTQQSLPFCARSEARICGS